MGDTLVRRICILLAAAFFVLAGCYDGLDEGDSREAPPGHHNRVEDYQWYVSYDDGTVIRKYFSDIQPIFDPLASTLEMEQVRAKGNVLHDHVSLPVDNLSITIVIKQPVKSDSEDLNDFEWRLIFVDASGRRMEFYLHHAPEELWSVYSNTRVVKMVRGYTRTGDSATGYSFSEYYLAGPVEFFSVEERPSNGW